MAGDLQSVAVVPMKTACLVLTIGFATFGLQTTSVPAPPDTREIQHKLSELSTRITALHAKHADRALIADVDIYRKAAAYILRFPEEFANPALVADTLSVLEPA